MLSPSAPSFVESSPSSSVNMSVRPLDEWVIDRTQILPLLALRGATIGFDAMYYLEEYLANPRYREPLLAAHGGSPFCLKRIVEAHLQVLRNLGITPVFVFGGLEFGKEGVSSTTFVTSLQMNAQAWDYYDHKDAQKVVEAFANSDSVKPEHLCRTLQRILHEEGVYYQIAPYSAQAQLAYLDKLPARYVDAVVGSTELFIFDAQKVITRFDFEELTFCWVNRRDCVDDLRISDDFFTDVCLLAGSSLLPAFPPLANPAFYPKGYGIRDIVNMMHSLGRNVTSIVNHFADDPQLANSDYLEQYRRAYMTVKHHVVLKPDGKVEPLDSEHAPGDVHDFIGQRLPDELYFYMSKGMISPRVPTWLTSGIIFIQPPLDGGSSHEYKNLVRNQMNSLRIQCLSLLSSSLHRFYHNKQVVVQCWYEEVTENPDNIIYLKESSPLNETIADWNVRQADLEIASKRLRLPMKSLRFAMMSLADEHFAARTVTPRKPDKPLITRDEIICNVLWRFLQLRGYIDNNHQLTNTGTALLAGMATAHALDDFEEPLLLAAELAQLGLLSTNMHFFAGYSGGPMTGTEEDQKNCLLVSRIACLGKLDHGPMGYSGPLDRQLLAYLCMITIVREGLRDLLEVVLATMFLNGNVDRDRNDFADFAFDLPFMDETNCALGIAVRVYLDDLSGLLRPVLPEWKEETKVKGKVWIEFATDFANSIDLSFRLWDAVYAMVQTSETRLKNRHEWQEVNEWLEDLRRYHIVTIGTETAYVMISN